MTSRTKWRSWLNQNHNKSKGVWLTFFRKHTGAEGINYEEAVEEALCFGWIDSMIKRIDDDKYVRKFTPRSNHENWSALNIRRAKKMIKAGKMTPVGLEKFKTVLHKKAAIKKAKRPQVVLREYIRAALLANRPAWDNFNALAKSYQGQYIFWIDSAKKEDTRKHRLTESIELLIKNQRLGLR